ncbi:tetratricopeptide repeat protein [Croceitalea sp. MTPC9]|uniref:SH3 domain-containing protein n=1 Tax=unclassified Croceitalea TaxID=2632280 RepID=UPI002B37DB34|nr:tetratricopeptide repeat protein [Croceitalea sp. MTPC6]GMN16761.1 tetratricopeptide repeat protein [Croceitalea sp. MTPC9]
MIKDIVVVLVFLFVTGISAQNEVLFSRATDAYNEGDYGKAIKYYQNILDNGKHSAELYFNMANAYYKRDEIGPSIYYYEKALLLKPNDQEIINNLGYAQNMRLDAIDKMPESAMTRFYNTVIGRFSFDQWAYFGVVMIILFVLAYLAYYLLNMATQKRISFIVSMTALILCVVSITFAYLQYDVYITDNPAIIFEREVAVTSEPNQRSERIFTLHEGTKVNVLEELNDWVKIKIADGQTGWLPVESLKVLKGF